MKKYKVIISEAAGQDFEKIISYLKYDLLEDIIADKYKILFKTKLKELENIAESMPNVNETLIGHKNIKKLNAKNYIIFYKIDTQNNIVYVIRVGHAFMDWEKYLKEF